MPDLEREFLYRLLNANSGGNASQDTLYVGELPPDFPVKLPEGSRIVGATASAPSLSLNNAYRTYRVHDHTRVLLDSVLSVPEFIEQMQSGLDDSWENSDWPHMMQHQGFLPAEAQDSLNLSSPALNKSLNVQAFNIGGVTQVTLDLNSQSDEDRERMQMHFKQRPQRIAVQVRVPVQATVQHNGGGQSGNHWSSEAVIGSELNATELLNFFGEQLNANGWQLLTRGQTSTLEAASWTDIRGQFVLISLSRSGPSYQAGMTTVQNQNEPPGGSSSSYTVALK
jgi:hypothetical protein